MFFELTENGAVVDKTDLIPVDNIMSVTLGNAADRSQQLHRKGFLIALNSNVNSGDPVAGQDYIITLTYRENAGEEMTYEKFAEAHATSSSTAATLLQELAYSFLINKNTEGTAFYELYTAAGVAITLANYNTVTAAGFYVVEPLPGWSLGRWPETLEKMSIATNAILVDTDMVSEWLSSYTPVEVDDANGVNLVSPIYNTHKVADIEYFALGEKGNPAYRHKAYRDFIQANVKIDPNAAYGYDILTIHFAFKGHNAANQRSEKDCMLLAKHPSGSSVATVLTNAKDAIEGYLAARAKDLE